MDEIVKIVANKNIERKTLDKNNILEICNILKNKNGYCKDYKVFIKKRNPFGDKTYGIVLGNEVIFYEENLDETHEIVYKDMSLYGSIDGSKIDVYNFTTLFAIFHEFTHIGHFNNIYNGRNTIDRKLFSICHELQRFYDFYDRYYKIFILEVNANCKGSLNAFNIYNKMPKELITANDKKIYASYVLNVFKSSYFVDPINEVIISPSELLLEAATREYSSRASVTINELKEIVNEENNLTLYKKIILGLPLTFMEYAYFLLISTCAKSSEDFSFVKKLQKRI